MFMTEAVICPLRGEDISTLAALAREIWRAHYPGIISTAQIEYMLAERYDDAVIHEELMRQDLWWDVLMVDNRMTGYASYFLTDAEGEMKLDKLYLHPRAHRRGYGGKLIDHVAAFAAQRGCRRLTLAVNRHNHTAIAAYQKHGFQVIGTSVREIGGGFLMDDYIMTKSVNGLTIERASHV
jgi:ribosomal protein S18 acetylase RimI-like enzyme